MPDIYEGHHWLHCEEHNFDYPSGASCPFCDADEKDMFEPDLDAEYTMDGYEPEWIKKFKLNVRLAYWTFRAKLEDAIQYIKLKLGREA
jgi:hypothetical protein